MSERVGLIGKLPAHGDFVRRGPASVTTYFERWLDDELAQVDPASRGAMLAALPTWTFISRSEAGDIAGAMCASCDRIGRLFPLLVFADRVDPTMLVARANGLRGVLSGIAPDVTADALVAAISPAPDGEAADPPLVAGSLWWRDTIADGVAFPDLPRAADVFTELAQETA